MKTYLLKAGMREAIAKAGETDIAVAYNAKTWIDEYPAGNPQLMVTTPGGKRVPVTVETVDNLITGQVPNELLAGSGVYSYVFVWTSGSAQLESGRCECLVLGSSLAKDLVHDSRRTPEWAERIFLAAEVIEGAVNGAMEARNTAADMASEAETHRTAAENAQEAAENAQEAAETAQDGAEAAEQRAIEVRNSIPPTYTELSDKVDDLKSAINKSDSVDFVEETYKTKQEIANASTGHIIVERDAVGNGKMNVVAEIMPSVNGVDATPTTPISIGSTSVVHLHRSTKNLLKITASSSVVNGVTITINLDGSIHIEGESTDRVSYTIADKIPFYAGTYTATVFRGNTNIGGIIIEAYNSTGAWVAALTSLTANNPTGNFTFDTTTSATLKVTLNIPSGRTINETLYPVISLSESALTSDVSNWVNYANILTNEDYQQFTAYNVAFSSFAGHIKIIGTSSATQQYYFLVNKPCLAGTYTLKLDCSVAPQIGAILNETNANGDFVRTLGLMYLDGTTNNSITFTLQHDGYLTGYLNISASKTLDTIITPVLTVGLASADTIKSNHEIFDIALSNPIYIGALNTENNTYTNEGYAIILNGSEGWSVNTQTGNNRYTLNTSTAKNTDNPYSLCSHFVENDWAMTNNSFYISGSGQIYIRYDDANDLDEFKAWLANNNVTICYRKQNKTTHVLAYNDTITTLYGTNCVWVDESNVSLSVLYKAAPELIVADVSAQVQSCVTPESFGAVGDGTHDDTAAIISAMRYCERNNTALYLGGIYIVNGELQTTGISIIGNGRGVLKFNSANAALHINQPVPIPGDTSELYIVQDFTIDCNNIANAGIVSDGYRIRYTNINIVNVHQYGIKMVRGYENILSGIHISATAPGTTGIWSTVGDNEFYDITMIDVQIAINEVSDSGSSYARIHPWIYTASYLQGSIFFKIDSWTCSVLTDCVCDTYQTAFWFPNGTASNLQVKGLKHLMNTSITNQSGITATPIYWLYYADAPSNPIYEMRIKFSQCYAPDYPLRNGWTFNESNLSEQWAYYDGGCNLHFSDRIDCRSIRRTIPTHGVSIDKSLAVLDDDLVTLNIEGTPEQTILGQDVRIIDINDNALSMMYPDGAYRVPIYYSTLNKWDLEGVCFGYLNIIDDNTTRQMTLNAKLPSTAKYFVIATNYHVTSSKFR